MSIIIIIIISHKKTLQITDKSQSNSSAFIENYEVSSIDKEIDLDSIISITSSEMLLNTTDEIATDGQVETPSHSSDQSQSYYINNGIQQQMANLQHWDCTGLVSALCPFYMNII